ncbi:thioesterase II family protein [Streptomyces sp. NPDC056405]|uniref:thioesterase II family protein n=1 Tax=Streptomyces sp. NPDC056405 TaxID=3345811 RepID=UPI0035D60A1D
MRSRSVQPALHSASVAMFLQSPRTVYRGDLVRMRSPETQGDKSVRPYVRVELRDGHLEIGHGISPALRVFFFPHAGGSAMSLLPLASELPAGTQALLFDLPGRGVREGEPRPATFDDACSAVAHQVEPLLDRPALFFGHSLGGLLCDAVVRSLPAERRHQVRKVIVSSAMAPRQTAARVARPPAPPPRRPREDLLALLSGFGGTPQEILDAPELLGVVVDAFGDDMLLVDSYRLRPGLPVPDSEYEFWAGREDMFDAASEWDVWAGTVARPLRRRVFPGGHFYLTDGTEARVALRETVTALLLNITSPPGQEALT